MSMYSKLNNDKCLDIEDIDKCLDGNLCRCTGYRPIVEGFRKCAQEPSFTDDLNTLKEFKVKSVHFQNDTNDCYLPTSLKDLKTILQHEFDYAFVQGDTGTYQIQKVILNF